MAEATSTRFPSISSFTAAPARPSIHSRPPGLDVIALVCSPRHDRLAALNTISFGCAPLSCNLEAGNYPVNQWCLLDQIDDARLAMENFASEKPEPGPYMIAEVWRCGE